MKKNATISISAFIWLTSLSLVLVFVFVFLDSSRSIRDIRERAAEVREVSLPEIMETQRSFINIESLRRQAEVAYVSDNPKTRRAARINAQALAAESVFSENSDFYREAQNLARLIAELVGRRDAASENSLRLQALSREYSSTLLHMAAYIPNVQVIRDIIDAYYQTSIPQAGTGGISRESVESMKAMRDTDARQVEFIGGQCLRYAVLYASLIPLCERQGALHAEYVAAQDMLTENFVSAHEQWKMIDAGLREMRDNVSSDSEFVTSDALASIEDTAFRALSTTMLLFAGGAVFFLVYIFVLHWFIVRPVHWTGKKLQEIQQGELYGEVPKVRIDELYHVADLLDRFSVHLVELTSRASQYEEDAAEKRDLEALMGAVFQVSVDGYLLWRPGCLLTANKELFKLLGLRDLDALRQNVLEVGVMGGEEPEELFSRVLNAGFFRKEAMLLGAGGVFLPVEVSCLPVKRQGEMCVMSYFRDLREQKRTEAVLRAAKEQAEEAAQVKSEFLARMSHEIRTPMNGVLGLTHLALAAAPPPEQRQYLDKIQASARILLRVINDILDFSKMESGSFVLESRDFVFAAMLATVQDLFRAQAQDKGLAFVVEADPNIPARVRGDELRLSQVLLNLCGNALKFTEQGSVTLRVRLEQSDADGIWLYFAIADTGVGMTERQLAGLFQPFAQADTSTTRKYGGTGLGLVISKLIVEMMRGTITVESAPGRGSTFSFSVRLARAGGEAEALAAPGQEEESDACLHGLRLLLTEDNEINQEIAVVLLESLGITVFVAGNGEEALAILAHQDVDGVLMDIQMPVMDGLTAARAIRERGREAVRHVPIIAMTAHAMQEDRQKSFAAGMNDHITKPIDVEELRRKLLLLFEPCGRKDGSGSVKQ